MKNNINEHEEIEAIYESVIDNDDAILVILSELMPLEELIKILNDTGEVTPKGGIIYDD